MNSARAHVPPGAEIDCIYPTPPSVVAFHMSPENLHVHHNMYVATLIVTIISQGHDGQDPGHDRGGERRGQVRGIRSTQYTVWRTANKCWSWAIGRSRQERVSQVVHGQVEGHEGVDVDE